MFATDEISWTVSWMPMMLMMMLMMVMLMMMMMVMLLVMVLRLDAICSLYIHIPYLVDIVALVRHVRTLVSNIVIA